MNGVESCINRGEMAYPVFGRNGSPPLSDTEGGVLASSRDAIAQFIGTDGYIEVTGLLLENFEVYLNRKPVEMAIEDLKPGLLSDLATWVASELADDPEGAAQAQARIRPQAAAKLLW